MYVSCLLNGSIATAFVCFPNRKEICYCLLQKTTNKDNKMQGKEEEKKEKNKKEIEETPKGASLIRI
jgi:hypothetical protein